MEFRLTKELIDQIMFGMENQDADFLLDTHGPQLLRAEEATEDEDEERYVSLPVWRSVDGYNLMEKFVATLNNPIYREILRRILASGRGVFRQFKDALKQKKEIERLWFHFKEREMRSLVVEWYNTLRDSWGLERIEEPTGDETDALVLSDFVIEQLSPEELAVPADQIAELQEEVAVGALARVVDRMSFEECFPDYPDSFIDFLYARRSAGFPGPETEERIYGMKTPSGDLAGLIRGADEDLSDGRRVSTIITLYIFPEFRGLGLATTLFMHYAHASYDARIEFLLFDLPGSSDVLGEMMRREGAEEIAASMRLNVTRWYRDNFEQP